MTKEIKGVLFDFNGTMVFDGNMHKEAWSTFSLKYRGIPISDSEIENMHGRTNKQIIKLLLQHEISKEESEQLSKDKEALYREICKKQGKNYQLVTGIEHFLNILKQRNIPMAICSASIKDNMDFFYDYFHLERWFPRSHLVYDDGRHINKVSMFQEGASILKIPIEHCVVFEDSLSGIQFANEAHCARIIAITSLEKKKDYKNLLGVSQIITDYEDFDMTIFDKN